MKSKVLIQVDCDGKYALSSHYIHINNIMAYIIPMASFANKEEYDAFIGFIKTKCGTADIY